MCAAVFAAVGEGGFFSLCRKHQKFTNQLEMKVVVFMYAVDESDNPRDKSGASKSAVCSKHGLSPTNNCRSPLFNPCGAAPATLHPLALSVVLR